MMLDNLEGYKLNSMPNLTGPPFSSMAKLSYNVKVHIPAKLACQPDCLKHMK